MEKKLKKTYKDSYKSSLVCLPVLSAILLGGCASYPVNPPLQQLNEETGYRLATRTLGPKNSDDLFVVMALSGGGKHAAALLPKCSHNAL